MLSNALVVVSPVSAASRLPLQSGCTQIEVTDIANRASSIPRILFGPIYLSLAWYELVENMF